MDGAEETEGEGEQRKGDYESITMPTDALRNVCIMVG
jgi:hypothetical protein